MSNAVPSPDEVSALVLGAGEGQRMGQRAKAFIEAGGVTLLERAVDRIGAFASEVIVGLRQADLDRGHAALGDRPVILVAGGMTRQDTIANLAAHATRPLVLIHDVARPFLDPEVFAASLSAASTHGAAVAFLPASRRNAVAIRDGEHFGRSLVRDDVILTQTPQTFRRDVLLDALRQARENGWQDVSPAATVNRAGYRVRLVLGSQADLKLTFPEDIDEIRRRIAEETGARP